MGPPIDQLTADGFDMQFGTNVIGTFPPPTRAHPHSPSPPLSTGRPLPLHGAADARAPRGRAERAGPARARGHDVLVGRDVREDRLSLVPRRPGAQAIFEGGVVRAEQARESFDSMSM